MWADAQACKSEQLEHEVQQMRSDLQQATNMLQHTGDAVQEQALINQQLQEQMRKVRCCLAHSPLHHAISPTQHTITLHCKVAPYGDKDPRGARGKGLQG